MDLTRPRDPQDSYQEGERFLASCEVPEGRPVANITWFIGTFVSSQIFELFPRHAEYIKPMTVTKSSKLGNFSFIREF
jgi:hypothetical protein